MKIKLLKLLGAQDVGTARTADYLSRKLGISATFDVQRISDFPKTYKPNPLFPDASAIDSVPYLKYGKGYDWLIVLWNTGGVEAITTTGYDIFSGCIVTQMALTSADDFYRQTSHEDYHGFWGFLGATLHYSEDTMDVRLTDESYSHEHDIENPEGNRERNLKALQPYLPKLQARYNASELPLTPTQRSGWLQVLAQAKRTLQGLLAKLQGQKPQFSLYPRVERLRDQLIARMAALGHPIKVTGEYRTIEAQDALYAIGRTRPGTIVTNAKGGESFHNYHVAFDVAFADGSGVTYEGPWDILGTEGKGLGLEWGGNFPNLVDRPHFQYTGGYSLEDFQKGRVDYSRFS